MDCPEIYSEEVFDFILDVGDNYNGATPIVPVCEQKIGDQYTVAYMDSRGAPELSIYHYTYSAIPAVLSPVAELYLEESCIVPVMENEVLGLKGQGVIAGFVDTGINAESETFQYVGGGTRIVTLWDQTKLPDTEEKVSYAGYGTVYTRKDINAALEPQITPVAEAGRNIPEASSSRALPRDEVGHGSYLAGIVAGTNGGIAPLAEIAVVKLKPCKQYLREFYRIPTDALCYQENDIMMGIQFLKEYAKAAGKPLVLCLGLGTNMGSHTGSAYLGQFLNRMNLTNANLVVCAAGNEALMRHHYRGFLEIQGGSEEVQIQVEEGSPGFWVECWSQAPQSFYINVISPSGEEMSGVIAQAAGERQHRFALENTLVVQSVRFVYREGGSQLIFTRFENPVAGVWKLKVFGKVVTTGVYHMWLPMEEQLRKPVSFLRPDPDVTITEPGNAISILTVGAYDAGTGGIYIQSGRGYTAAEQIKPDLVAPGVNVVSPYENRSDTSTCAATAITAGASILYIQWITYVRQGLPVTGNAVKQGLILGARTGPEQSFPNREWGYGTLCLLDTLRL